MNGFSLYARMRAHGTLSEPGGIPDATFALPSTINWMRALAILVSELDLTFASSGARYVNVQRRGMGDAEINSACEQLLFALNQLAALRALTAAPNKADVARIAIMAWYYGVYGAASAMVVAADGSFPDNHTATAQAWDRQIASVGLALPPFGDRVPNLVAEEVKVALAPVRARGVHSLTRKPSTLEQAWGCHAEYLAGTASWEQWNIQERVRDSREFKALGVDAFRTREARALRDSAFGRRGIAFLHEASRYRGKANYRDAIYLAYGRSVATQLEGFIDDLASVLKGFAAMAAAYAARRVGLDNWTAFLIDLEAKGSLSISPLTEWS